MQPICIHSAVKVKDVELVSKLLKQGHDVNSRQLNMTLLHTAAEQGDAPMLNLLISHGADLEVKTDGDEWRPIHLAARHNHPEAIEILVKAGAEVNADNTFLGDPVEETIAPGVWEWPEADFIPPSGVRTTYPERRGGYTPLHRASFNGHPEATQKLVDLGARVDVQCQKNKETALHFACAQGFPDVVEILAPRGNVNVLDSKQQTPLYMAYRPEITRCLLANGASIYTGGGQYNNTVLEVRISSLPHTPVQYTKEEWQKWNVDSLEVLNTHLVQSQIGAGGFGSVSRHTVPWSEDPVVIKQCKDRSSSRSGDDDLEVEYILTKRLDHPNIVKALKYDAGMHLLYLEWLPGGSVAAALHSCQHHRFEEATIQRYLVDSLRALVYLQEKGIIHCDIKPANMLLDKNRNLKLCDFGISIQLPMKKQPPPSRETIAQEAAMDASEEIQLNTVRGTDGYAAPEASQGVYCFSSDLYALGCSVVTMATGKWSLRRSVPAHLSEGLKRLLSLWLTFDRTKRGTAASALQDPYFATALPLQFGPTTTSTVVTPPVATPRTSSSNQLSSAIETYFQLRMSRGSPTSALSEELEAYYQMTLSSIRDQ